MNNYYTLRYLVSGIKHKLNGVFFVSANTAGKNVIDLLFENSNEKFPLRVSIAPGHQLIFFDFIRKKAKSNTLDFFEDLEGRKVTGVDLADADRLITIHFDVNTRLVIQLYGSAGNIFYCVRGIIEETFKSPDRYNGKPEPVPRPPSIRKPSVSGDLYRDLLNLNPLLPRTSLKDIPEIVNVNQYTEDELIDIGSHLEQVLLNRLEPGLNPDGRFNPWPNDVYPVPGKEVFDDVHKAVRTAYYSSQKNKRFFQKFNMLQKMLEKQRDRYLKRLESLDQTEKTRERIGKNEKSGHLLMANLHKTPPSPDSITVQDLFAEGEIDIALEPGMSLAENANLYYEKAKKGKRSVESASEKREEVENNAAMSEKLLISLMSIEHTGNPDLLEKWLDENKTELKLLNLDETEIRGEVFPFRRAEIDRYDVWIGKNATNNDTLLRASHKEDIWMHARDVTGSHLIIRMNRITGFPDTGTLEKAASVAAWYSKAKTVGLAPVVYAKRKHVRKPKGSAAGLALVEKEQVLLVKPEPLDNIQKS